MTEKSPALSTQLANPSQTILLSNHGAPPHQDGPPKVEPTVEGEEPYTIKCICSFSDDDGNTIYCETCDTWQHIECFYPNNIEDAIREDFAHSCHQCKPRPLDHQQAVERQRSRLSVAVAQQEAAPAKPKRPPSKSHKKKPKPTDLQLNGHPPAGPGENNNNKHSIPHDHPPPPPKKQKNSHKPSQSISSQAAKRSPSYGNNARAAHPHPHGHPPSPATTPPDLPCDFELYQQSPGFLSLYIEQDDAQIVQTNSFANLMIPNTMSLWVRDPDQVRLDTLQHWPDIFQHLPREFESLKRPPQVENRKVQYGPDGTVVRIKYLTAPSVVEKDTPLMELNGQIGFQKDYCADPDNRWDTLSCPLPFVFFHPMLPIYIDTRHEGSLARYVRHSCKSNAVLDIYLSGGTEYQFWLVSDRRIAAGEQVTIPWDFRFPKTVRQRWIRLLGLGDDDSSGGGGGAAGDDAQVDEAEYNSIGQWLHLVLTVYGGCACQLGDNCAFARFTRNHQKSQARLKDLPAKKKPRKPKNHTISPTSTGHATNSRAPSEGHADDGLDNDGKSLSDSSRSKPPSRDMTPARQGSFDTLGILTEPTDRDKRKVAMVEDSFRRLEQQPRKKKRISDGTGNPTTAAAATVTTTTTTTTNTTTATATKGAKTRGSATGGHATNGVTERRYVDAGTSRSKSGSPSSVVSPQTVSNPFPGSVTVVSRHTSAAPHAGYCDVGIQTDPVDGEWYSESGQTPRPRRRIVSLSKRLLDNRHRLRLDEEEKRRQRESLPTPCPTTAETTETNASAAAAAAAGGDPSTISSDPLSAATDPDKEAVLAAISASDTVMTDAPPATSPGNSAKASPILPSGPPSALTSPTKNKSPDLRVQMPPVPPFTSQGSGLSAASTPLSASSMVQSPFSTLIPSPFGPAAVNGVAASPSPVKKKLSLSDYTKSRKAAASRPSVGTSLKSSTSNADDPKSATSVEGLGAADSPTAEKPADTLMNSSIPPTTASTTTTITTTTAATATAGSV